MASISVGGHGGKRPVDAEIPLVPFIDLLLCCVMFLLVTAVWSQLSRLEASGPAGGPATEVTAPPETPPSLLLDRDGWHVSSGAGDRLDGLAADTAGLRAALANLRTHGAGRRLAVGSDDDVGYERVIGALDSAMAAGFVDVSMADAQSVSW